MNAAQWMKIPVLLELEEMRQLLITLGSPHLFFMGVLVPPGGGSCSCEEFLRLYDLYLQEMKQGIEPKTRHFAMIWTQDVHAVERQQMSDGREKIIPIAPVLQVQPHTLQFDREQQTCRSMLYGSGGMPWGLTFSYPHVIEVDHEIVTVGHQFPNTAIFHKLRQYVRDHTRPTPLIFDEKKVNVPMRLGKQCFTWVGTTKWMLQEKIGLEDVPITG